MYSESAGVSTSVVVRVPAKVNLFLAVRHARDDGYHELVSVLQTVGMHDELRCVLVAPSGRVQHPAHPRRMAIEFAHDGGPGVPDGDGNLVLQAAWRLGLHAHVTDAVGSAAAPGGSGGPLTRLQLRKRIPVAAGMAGGSADAAAALVGLNELWGCRLDREELHDLAAQVGSDVPFCLAGGTAVASGRGAALARVLARGTYHWVVCAAAEALPTADVYRAWDRTCQPTHAQPDAVLSALRRQDPEALGAALHNDLEPAATALLPRLAEDRLALTEAGVLGVCMAGSGPTMLALCADRGEAQRVAAVAAKRFARVEVVTAPAGGPVLAGG